MLIHPAIIYVILSYVIALSMTSLAQVLSGTLVESDMNNEHVGHLLLLEIQ